MAHVFISYVRENQHQVDRLCAALRSQGIEVWLDREQLRPGYRWQQAIREAIRGGAFYVACFSQDYVSRSRTYMNEELTIAIDELRVRGTDRTWFIPVRLSECPIPDRSIGGGETLRDIQWVDLFPDFDEGLGKIAQVIRPHSIDPLRDAEKDNVRTSMARIGINQDASRTYFYVPGRDSNRYPNLHEYEHHSYSIFLFELNISANGIRIHEIHAFVYHPSFQEWTELEDARQTYLQNSRLPQTTKYLEGHMKVHSAFTSINIQSYPVVISFAKYGSHYKSLEHGYGHRLPVALVLHINTSYLYLFLEVPEMDIGQAFILDYKIFDSFGTEILEHWVSQPGWPLESRQRRRVIEISEAMP